MPGTARRYTVDELLAFPDDGNRYGLVDEELLSRVARDLEEHALAVRACCGS